MSTARTETSPSRPRDLNARDFSAEFRPDIQAVRALAVLLVVLYHADIPGVHGGFLGVDVFFVVSGFVITNVLLRERASKGTTSIPGFYARRIRRILPAATVVLVVTVFATYHWLSYITGGINAEDRFLNGRQFDSPFEAKVVLEDWQYENNLDL